MLKILHFGGIILFTFLSGNTGKLTLNESTVWLKKIKTNIDFSGGLMKINSSHKTNEINGYIEYNPELFQPKLDFTTVSRTGILDLSTNFEFDFNFNKKDKDYGNEAEISLPNSTPIKFNLDFSLSTVEMNLNNVEISSFNFDLEMGSADVDFGNETNSDCNYLNVDVGMGSLEIKNFGNLLCEESEIECGMGSIEIDFSGDNLKDNEFDISVGMGSIDLQIPKDVNVIINSDQSILSNLEFDAMNLIKTNIYRNETFDDSKPTLTFHCSVGLGNLSLGWIK